MRILEFRGIENGDVDLVGRVNFKKRVSGNRQHSADAVLDQIGGVHSFGSVSRSRKLVDDDTHHRQGARELSAK